MFPFDIEDEEIEYTSKEKTEPKEYGINFETGQLNGKIVTGKDAVKVWCYLALNTARFRFQQYSFDYGEDFEDLIGKGYSEEYIATEGKRMVEECLMQNEHVQGVSDFTFSFKDDELSVACAINTEWGDIEINV